MQGHAPEMSSPWLGCSMTVLTAARDWYSRWHPGARRSQIRTVPSSEPEYIHLLSFWKPTCAGQPAGGSAECEGSDKRVAVSRLLSIDQRARL